MSNLQLLKSNFVLSEEKLEKLMTQKQQISKMIKKMEQYSEKLVVEQNKFEHEVQIILEEKLNKKLM